MDLEIPYAISSNGIKSRFNGTAQVKIDGREEYIHIAADQFLGKSIEEIKEIVLKEIEGHTRAVIEIMNLEEFYTTRMVFASKVQEELGVPFSKIRLKLISYNLKEIKDSLGYLETLGKPKTAEAKRTAEIAEVENKKEAIIKAALTKKEGNIARLKAEIEFAQAQKESK